MVKVPVKHTLTLVGIGVVGLGVIGFGLGFGVCLFVGTAVGGGGPVGDGVIRHSSNPFHDNSAQQASGELYPVECVGLYPPHGFASLQLWSGVLGDDSIDHMSRKQISAHGVSTR